MNYITILCAFSSHDTDLGISYDPGAAALAVEKHTTVQLEINRIAKLYFTFISEVLP